MSIAEQSIAGPWRVSNHEYHADHDFISHSMMEDFRDWSPTYFARYVAKTEERDEPTPTMKLGTAFHIITLEQDISSIAVMPVLGRSKCAMEERDAWLEANAGKTIITQEQYYTATLMATAVKKHPEVDWLLENALDRELGVRWTDQQTGIRCKCRPDILSHGIIADLKSISDISQDGILRQAANLGYHRQADWYLQGVRQGLGELCEFVHVFVQNKHPFGVVCVKLGERSLDLARIENSTALRRLKSCYDSGDWTDPKSTGVNKWELPRWAFLEQGT